MSLQKCVQTGRRWEMEAAVRTVPAAGIVVLGLKRNVHRVPRDGLRYERSLSLNQTALTCVSATQKKVTIVFIGDTHLPVCCFPFSVSCQAGEQPTVSQTDCEPCRRGTYQPLAGQVECIKCPSGTSTKEEGAHDKSQCRRQ